MELIESYCFPCFLDFLFGIFATLEPVQRIEPLVGVQHILALAVVFLNFRNRGVAAFEYELHFPFVHRPGIHLRLDGIDELAGCRKICRREVRICVESKDGVDVGFGRSAAMVTHSYADEGGMVGCRTGLEIAGRIFSETGIVDVGTVGSYPGTVRALPGE